MARIVANPGILGGKPKNALISIRIPKDVM